MQIKIKKKKSLSPNPSVVRHPGLGVAVITHSQEAKQSHDYQSISASYGITITVKDNLSAIHQGMTFCENVVENLLKKKAGDHAKVLGKIPA